MAKCLVLCLLMVLLIQTSLLVLGEETTTRLDASNSESETTSKMQQTEPLADEPTRLPSKIQTTMPPLVHNAAHNVTAAIDTIKNKTKDVMNSSVEKSDNPEKPKGAASSLFSSIQIVIVSVIGVFLSASAI